MADAICHDAKEYRLLGVRIQAYVANELEAVIREAVRSRRQTVIAHQNLHGVYMCHRDEAVRRLHAESRVLIDGMPLVFWGQLLGLPMTRAHRVTFVDWLPDLLTCAGSEGWRVFYLGSRPETLARGADVLRQRHQGLMLHTHHGHFDMDSDSRSNIAVCNEINRFAPDVLFVGMGMPRQERWVLENRERLDVPAILPCGAAIDYIAGAIPTPPRWMGQVGLEWLFRLLSEPRRLARRYLVEPWLLTGHALHDLRSMRTRQ